MAVDDSACFYTTLSQLSLDSTFSKYKPPTYNKSKITKIYITEL